MLKITTRSYLIKDGRSATQGTPSELVRDPIAIQEYLGVGFNDNSYRTPNRPSRAPPPTMPTPIHVAPSPPPPPPRTLDFPGPAHKVSAAQMILEQEKIQKLIENLKSADQAKTAAPNW